MQLIGIILFAFLVAMGGYFKDSIPITMEGVVIFGAIFIPGAIAFAVGHWIYETKKYGNPKATK